MEVSYKKLWMLLIERNIKKSTLRQELNLASETWAKLNMLHLNPRRKR